MATTPQVELKKGDLARMSEITGRSKPHIHYCLIGDRIPSRELAGQIAAYLGRPVAELFPDLPQETAVGA